MTTAGFVYATVASAAATALSHRYGRKYAMATAQGWYDYTYTITSDTIPGAGVPEPGIAAF